MILLVLRTYLFDYLWARVRRLPPDLVGVDPRRRQDGRDVVPAPQGDGAQVVPGADQVGRGHVEHVLEGVDEFDRNLNVLNMFWKEEEIQERRLNVVHCYVCYTCMSKLMICMFWKELELYFVVECCQLSAI